MSRPSIILFLIGDAEASSLNKKAGLRFAKSSSSFLRVSNACSGLSSQLRFSYFGPPTAPNKIASESLAQLKTSAGIGDP